MNKILLQGSVTLAQTFVDNTKRDRDWIKIGEILSATYTNGLVVKIRTKLNMQLVILYNIMKIVD